MPVRSLNSPILKWPGIETVLTSLQIWAKRLVSEQPDVIRIGYFGSYARKDWGVGSDLDLLIVLEDSIKGAVNRIDTTPLPVPVDLISYTESEFKRIKQEARLTAILEEVIWIVERPAHC